MKHLLLAAGAVALLLSGTGAAAPAQAASTETTDTVSVPLRFTGYDAERAARYGYEVRVDDHGFEYAVPTGTPPGSKDGATPKFDPVTGRMVETTAQGGAPTSKTVPGDCGTATFDFTSNTTFYTAHDLNGSLGAAVFHSWHVAITSRIDAGSYDLSGLPPVPGASLHWEDTHGWDEVADRNTIVDGLAGGEVTTTLGSCVSG